MAVTYLVDSNDNDRTIPAVGDRVRVKAREGMYVVLRVDERAGKADLVKCEFQPQQVNVGVPLDLISPAEDYLAELFRWYVEEAPEQNADGTSG